MWLFLLLPSLLSALTCYQGTYKTFQERQTIFGDFYEIECQRRQACVTWTSTNPNFKTVSFGCSRNCLGRMHCCIADLCNRDWIEAYQRANKVETTAQAGKKLHLKSRKVTFNTKKKEPKIEWKSFKEEPKKPQNNSEMLIFFSLIGLISIICLSVSLILYLTSRSS